MIRMTTLDAAAATGGRLLAPGSPWFSGLSIDSRMVAPGQAFVAISGERFDGHEYLRQAAEAGASLLVTSRAPGGPLPEGTGVLLVPETRAALGLLGRAWRLRVAPRTVAITGSVGKTTTKELTRNILSGMGPTHSTPGNFNNDIGLPLTLAAMPPDTRFLVLELGMNHPGEIAALARLALPDVAAITCLAPVHLEGLGSMEAIAAAKAELLEALDPAAGVAVVPDGEALLGPWVELLPRVLRFGSREGCDVRLLDRRPLGREGSSLRLGLPGRELELRLPLAGEHNAKNAAAAAAAALAAGASDEDIVRGLSSPPELRHRSVVRSVGGFSVLDDCYNANPAAMTAALETLGELAGAAPRVAVLGAMLELGEQEGRFHEEVGRAAARAGLALLVAVGPLGRLMAAGARQAGMAPASVVEAANAAEAAELAARLAPPGAWLLIKASRGARLEVVIDRLVSLCEI